MKKILYVTTFNKKIFDSTAKKSLQTFVRYSVEGDLLIGYEDDIKSEIEEAVLEIRRNSIGNIDTDFEHQKLFLHDIDRNPWVQDWLKQNIDIIPLELGGLAPACQCGVAGQQWRKHKPGCVHSGFNRRASQWFRKIAILDIARSKYDYEMIVFIDADSEFTACLHENYVVGVFGEADVIYHLGPYRKSVGTGIESGFIGFRGTKGSEFLKEVIRKFASGEFKKYDRWDDGYIFRKTVEENPQFKYKDLVPQHPVKEFCPVICYGPFANYFIHYKGEHYRKHKIV